MSKTLLMVHGMWGGGWIWSSMQSYFEARGYTCIAPTLRHHDLKPRETPDPALGRVSLNDYVDDMEELIKTLPEKPIAVGHSMGGMIVQLLAQRNLLAGMVLCAPAPPSDIPALSLGGIRSFLGLLTTWGFWRKPHRPTYESMVYSSLQLIPESERRGYYDKIVYDSGRAVVEIALPFLDGNKTTRVDAEKVSCPGLVLAGQDDCLIPLKAIRRVSQKYGAEFQEYAGQTHWLVVEPGWEKAAQTIESWLDKHS